MSEDDDIDALAAEYVLGTLEADERARVAMRRHAEPELDTAIKAWEMRLGPLAEAVRPVEPPDHLFASIEQRISAPSSSVSEPALLVTRRQLRRWRIGAVGAGALAACLAVALIVQRVEAPPATNFVAVLQQSANSPAFVVSVDISNRTLMVRPVSASAQPDRDYELWLVNPTLGAPRSLGVINVQNVTLAHAAYDPDVVENSTYAVSVEPKGGSPTGAPTGPVVFTGKLIPVSP